MDELDLGRTVRGLSGGEKVFRRYTLIRILGRGGMGVVWLARDEELEREVALKFLPELLLTDQSVLRGLKRETTRSLQLTHPHIVRIYDFVSDEQSACISMEYVNGDTLSNGRANKPSDFFEPSEITEWIRQLCDALDYAHTKAQIVHRDLKPANLMVNARGDLKVADFGIARSLTDSVSMVTVTQGTSGTLLYMSPQQLEGENPSHLDDIYSVGATIYELLTGKPPFHTGQVDRQIREKPAPSMTERRSALGISNALTLPAEWEKTVAACLAKDPGARPQSAIDLAERLGLRKETAIPRPAPVGPAQSLEHPVSSVSRFGKPGLGVVLSAVGLIIATSIVCWWVLRPKQVSYADPVVMSLPAITQTPVISAANAAVTGYSPPAAQAPVVAAKVIPPDTVVLEYFSAINRRDFVGAYSLTSEGFHARIPQERYAKIFFATQKVEINNIYLRSSNDASAVVSLSLREFDDRGKPTDWSGEIDLVNENSKWRIDSMANLVAATESDNARSSDGSAAWPGEVFPETRTRLLTAADVSSWNSDKLRYAINEMYARGGYDFRVAEVKRVFMNVPWYPARLVLGRTQEEAEAQFSPIEKANLDLLQKIRHAHQ